MLPKQKKLVFQVQFQQTQSPYQVKGGDIYLSKFLQLRQEVTNNLQQFISVQVIPRPPPPHLIQSSNKYSKNAYLDIRKNKLVQYPRKNSFEIYVDNFELFSRLQSGCWPDISAICEWALRVTQKLVDLQIEHEENPFIEKADSKQLKEQLNVEALFKNQRLPKVGKNIEKGKQQKNTSFNFYPKSRYNSIKDDPLLPYGIQPMNYTVSRKMPSLKISAKTQRKLKNSINRQSRGFTNSPARSRSKEQSFHWHLKREISNSRKQERYNNILFNTLDIPTKNTIVQLSPLPAVNRKIPENIKNQSTITNKIETIQLKLSDSDLNCYKEHYYFKGNQIAKMQFDEIWSPILCENPLPLVGEYSFLLQVVRSKNNHIQLGIAPLLFYPRIGNSQKPDCLLSFNCGNGYIKDSRHNPFASETYWREGGLKVSKKIRFILKAIINMKNKVIEWQVDSNTVASAKLPAQFNNGFRPFVSLYNCQDIVYLNGLKQGQSFVGQTINRVNQIEAKNQKLIQTKIEANVNKQQKIYNPIQTKDKIMYPKIIQVDEITQTTQSFEGKIKKQRFQKLIEKNIGEKNKEIEFTYEQIESFNKKEIKERKKSGKQERANINKQLIGKDISLREIDQRRHGEQRENGQEKKKIIIQGRENQSMKIEEEGWKSEQKKDQVKKDQVKKDQPKKDQVKKDQVKKDQPMKLQPQFVQPFSSNQVAVQILTHPTPNQPADSHPSLQDYPLQQANNMITLHPHVNPPPPISESSTIH